MIFAQMLEIVALNDLVSVLSEFPVLSSMIFSKKTIRTTSIPEIRKIHSDVWKFKVNKRAMLRSLGGAQKNT